MRISLKAHALAALTAPLVAALVGCSSTGRIGTPVMMADADRDGVITAADAAGKDVWFRERGALILNNNDSDDGTRDPDWADEKINGEADLKDLAEVKIYRIPGLVEGRDSASLKLNAEAVERVRLFVKQPDGSYAALPRGESVALDVKQLTTTDIELRVEAATYADRTWDGQLKLMLQVSSPELEAPSVDFLTLRVAPWIMLSNDAKGRTLFVREHPGRNDELLAQLRELTPKTGADLYIIPAGEPYRSNNIWLQDAMEIGYTEIPGHRMNVVMKANRNKSLDEFPRNSLLGPDFGWMQVGQYRPEFGEGEGGNSWLDWYGNLEVTPPIKGYPMGRVYYGVSGSASLNPDVVDMINAQEVQGPALGLDVSWLLIRHVDEMLCFVPTGDPAKPYKILVPDFAGLKSFLEQCQKDGLGKTPILDRFHEGWTVDSLLADKALMDHNAKIDREQIQPMIDAALAGFAMTREDVIGIPTIHNADGGAVVPNMINALVLNGHLMMSDPNGPKRDGKDLLQEHVRLLLAGKIPQELHFLDDRQYHKWSGNLHCATNVTRDGFEAPWWTIR